MMCGPFRLSRRSLSLSGRVDSDANLLVGPRPRGAPGAASGGVWGSGWGVISRATWPAFS
jgi:hypothetical protein